MNPGGGCIERGDIQRGGEVGVEGDPEGLRCAVERVRRDVIDVVDDRHVRLISVRSEESSVRLGRRNKPAAGPETRRVLLGGCWLSCEIGD